MRAKRATTRAPIAQREPDEQTKGKERETMHVRGEHVTLGLAYARAHDGVGSARHRSRAHATNRGERVYLDG